MFGQEQNNETVRDDGDGPFEFSWKALFPTKTSRKPQLKLLTSTHSPNLNHEKFEHFGDRVKTYETTYKNRPTLRVISNSEHELVRKFDCHNYNTCLGLAAAMNWESFTCGKCKGNFNTQLFWKAHQFLKKDKLLAALCGLPSIAAVSKIEPTALEKQVDQLDSFIEEKTSLPVAFNFSKK